MSPEEFWNRVQPSGLTAEQELVAFWQRMKDCPCAGHKHPVSIPPPRVVRRKVRRDVDDDVLLFLL